MQPSCAKRVYPSNDRSMRRSRRAGPGAWCVGRCWALMAALFALGVMSLTWMVVVGGLIAVEKLLPGGILRTAWWH